MSRMTFFLKALAVGFLTLLLMIPLAMINGTIAERQNYREEAIETIAQSTARAQSLAGPVLIVPYTDEYTSVVTDEKGRQTLTRNKVEQHWTFFPKTLAMTGRMQPDELKLGLHRVRVYELRSQLQARFLQELPVATDGATRTVGRPYLSLSVADVRGVVGTPVLTVNGARTALLQGAGAYREDTGLHAPLAAARPGDKLDLGVQLDLVLKGTEALNIVPIADSNRITIDSAWPHPQFGGSFSPRSRHVSEKGFDALWEISSLAASTQAQYLHDKTGDSMDRLRISLVDPVNIYTQADRASKYGFLFVMLTFVGFFMFELIKRLAIHPIQYGLVGLALAIFFLLLISLSEHMEFWIAYLAASIACIGLLGVYLSAVLHSAVRGASFASMLTLLYAALYGLLVSEDNALVLGSLMLFVILAAIMLVTRRIDWYALGNNGTEPPPLPAASAGAGKP
ncbi:cell envelope integrity protein CreD [Arenimonas oryziterrae]|uniref:Inner membrane protein CreD n=1 Tax=Arenimonas oryziterrae DSM 21050 = YC6267 TaxID=1121015 RepID=A0A091B9Q0_9GAMM|nr:cell envelope integrity protein CreD [Arenimonas oryziterrae]KFN41190.1 hypothetical protein N789_04705 [Arenimonas oryziterrae DSM 21050 = YC6267]